MYSKLLALTNSAARLPPAQQAVYRCMYEQGMSEDEACRKLGITRVQLDEAVAAMARSLRAVVAV